MWPSKCPFAVRFLTILAFFAVSSSLSALTETVTDRVRPNGSQKSVTLSLAAKWKETPFHLESAEYLAEESNDHFWSFIDLLHRKYDSDYLQSIRMNDLYQIVVENVDELLRSPSKIALLKLSISVRSHSPAVEMFNQIAKDKRKQLGIQKNECPAFVEFSSPSNSPLHICDKSNLIDTLNKLEALRNSEKLLHPFVHRLDHVYPLSSSSDIVIILYGEIGTKSFVDLYEAIKDATKNFEFKFIVRHYIYRKFSSKVGLSGYGVELAIKSTEYKAQDDALVKGEKSSMTEALEEAEQKPDEVDGFVFSTLEKLHPDKINNLNEFRTYLMDSNKEIATLKVWQLQELSLQMAKKIISSPKEEQLKLLQDISQNFPVFAKSLINIPVDNRMRTEIERNQISFMQKLNLAPSDTALFINGMYFDMDSTDIFTLIHYLKQEMKLIEGLYRVLGNDHSKVKEMLKLEVNSGQIDYQIDIRDSAVIYINDIENDKDYRNWPSSLQDLLPPPIYPGTLRNVRKNMFHLVLVLDPGKRISFDLLKIAESFRFHRAPLRIGFVFAVNPNISISGFEDAGVACLNAFNYISENDSPYGGLSFLTDVIASSGAETKNEDLKPDDVVNLFQAKFPRANLDIVFGADSAFDTGRILAWEFLNRTGLGKPIKALFNGAILKDSNLNAELFEDAIIMEIMRLTPMIRKSVYNGELTDSMNVLDWFMSQKTVMSRLNQRILQDSSSDRHLDMTGLKSEDSSFEKFQSLNQPDMIATFKNKLRHLSNVKSECLPITVWIAANYETSEGRRLLISALEHLRSNSEHMRLGIIYTESNTFSLVIEAILNTIEKDISLLNLLIKTLSYFETSTLEIQKLKEFIPAESFEDFMAELKRLEENPEDIKRHIFFSRNLLKLNSNDLAVVVNGRVIEIPRSEIFIESDFALIEKQVKLTYGDKIIDQLTKKEKSDVSRCSDLIMAVGNVLTMFPQTKTRHETNNYESQNSAIVLEAPDKTAPALDFIAVVEPISRGAQKLAPILLTLQKVVNANIKVYLNCIEKHSEMPLKNFFRYVIDVEPTFSEKTGDIIKPKAHFASMPSSSLLTLGMVTPDNWLVESVSCPYDLDNIHLKQVEESGIVAYFDLAHLLLEGHCFEQSSGNPPRGLQFVLGTNSTPAAFDTIVMSNLGYFQLKANPGAWNLKLRPGRSQDLYTIVSHENTDSSSGEMDDVNIVISSFRSHVVKIRVNKRPGKQNEELLFDEDDAETDNSIWDSLTSWTSNKKNDSDDPENKKLNIFSVASGHLYERLLRIMMLSVLKHASDPVKFWFLKNYLSPGFKDFLPYMAEKYGFEYELVEYKWPRWLHQQTEKQRIIWGYKILFLDVLFPLSVKKIIFVDADQVVRTDLTELRDLDLEGAPYGYTPFCDSRKDMDGYRFWKSGYWASHLHGRKYHISALYVVDLQKFRRIAAGDRLRGQYQGLSQDPNSLSNLDQDLPNNMIHQVSIKSLPQEWLWCETWCDDKSKKKAKTIDLCNNPKTKEPKLTAARRIIPEWEGYDSEIKQLMEQYKKEKQGFKEKEATLDEKVALKDIGHPEHSEL